MLRCALFGHTITFQDPDERFFDLQYAGWTAQDQAKKKFLNWYDKCGNIETVLRGYKGFAQSVLNDLEIQPLFNSLRQYDIYDVSRDEYCASCADYTETEYALNFVAQQYTAIQNKREADAEYRAVRNLAPVASLRRRDLPPVSAGPELPAYPEEHCIFLWLCARGHR